MTISIISELASGMTQWFHRKKMMIKQNFHHLLIQTIALCPSHYPFRSGNSIFHFFLPFCVFVTTRIANSNQYSKNKNAAVTTRMETKNEIRSSWIFYMNWVYLGLLKVIKERRTLIWCCLCWNFHESERKIVI